MAGKDLRLNETHDQIRILLDIFMYFTAFMIAQLGSYYSMYIIPIIVSMIYFKHFKDNS